MTAFIQSYRAIIDEEAGVVLWPERWSLGALQRIRDERGSIFFNAEYQNIISEEGTTFRRDWLKYYSEAKKPNYALLPKAKDLNVFQAWDLAISLSDQADYTVGITGGWDKRKGGLYVLDVFRDRLDFPDGVHAIADKYIEMFQLGYRPIKIFIESNVYQVAMAQQTRLMGLPVIESRSKGNKEMRLQALSAYFEGGQIYLRDNMLEFLEEYVQYPFGKNDDQLDALEILVREVTKGTHKYRSKVF